MRIRLRIQLITLMRMQIRIQLITFKRMQIRILLITLMRIWILHFNLMDHTKIPSRDSFVVGKQEKH
jgi:hypothetical protein